MKKYDFDEIIDRHGSNCVKYDTLEKDFGNANLIPLWVADMDFRTPDFVVDAIRKRCDHGIFGYPIAPQSYWDSIIDWVKFRHGWDIKQEWLSYIPGIVKGIGFAVRCFTQPGDKVIIQTPVYHPFRIVPEGMQRKVVYNPMKRVGDTYEMDFEQLESVIDGCKMLILASPHNPAGIVWDLPTLQKLAEICDAHHVLVVSDEIHSEMTFPQFHHHPFPTVSQKAARNSITFMAPSKTFNIAGIVTSYSIIPNDELREKFYSWLEAGEFNAGTIFAYTATEAAYRNGADWLQQMLSYVQDNIRFVDDYLRSNIPAIHTCFPQASFLVWLDCRGLHLSQPQLVELFEKKAGLLLNDGTMFGPGGEGFMRLNVGCPRAILHEALDALRKSL